METSTLPPAIPLADTAVGHFEVDWNIGRKKRRHQRGTTDVLKASVFDLSATGACLLAPSDDHLRVGTRVIIGVRQMRGVVRVRWFHGAQEPDLAMFGVDHLSLSPDLESFLAEQLCSTPRRAPRDSCRGDLRTL